jgi:hypothetical protein
MIEIRARVRYNTSAYIASGGGLRASSAQSAKAAVERLAEKLAARFDQPTYADVDWIEGSDWQVLLDDREQLIAYCWANGVIEFGEALPEGALKVTEGTPFKVRELIEGTARLAYDGKTWLAPGVPEAPDQREACTALIKYCEWIGVRSAVKGAA